MGLSESLQAPVVIIQIFIKGEEKSLDLFTFHFVRDFFFFVCQDNKRKELHRQLRQALDLAGGRVWGTAAAFLG